MPVERGLGLAAQHRQGQLAVGQEIVAREFYGFHVVKIQQNGAICKVFRQNGDILV
jgi:hypothetical protein